jgi:hypothetical protein
MLFAVLLAAVNLQVHGISRMPDYSPPEKGVGLAYNDFGKAAVETKRLLRVPTPKIAAFRPRLRKSG